MDKYIGKKLEGRYEITELIGVGGMADVYKATDIIDNKEVAVKILKKEFAENEEFLRRFRNESKAIALLSHPNIVKVYDVNFSDRLQYIVMEYIDGITLKEYIDAEQVLTWKDSVHFIIQVLRALQHAHDRGIVHRDIKPQNIMLFTDGTIKVMDFGIAKFAREDNGTQSDQAIGTVHYISPEQARGDDTDEKSDIYSVGVMLYEMLTGQKPFDTDNPISIAVMHMQNTPKRPRVINPDIPVGLEEIILRAMEKDPENRYQTAADMIRDIEAFKANNSLTFGYYTGNSAAAADDEEETVSSPDSPTRYFSAAAAQKQMANNRKSVRVRPEYEEDDEYYDDEDEY
ncbi:MAG: serine/threonine protein kinase, partial [Oscillospiraceae bacterium]|nr:serine/threonine protein kinase [Oscillospiraceae bacterium]